MNSWWMIAPWKIHYCWWIYCIYMCMELWQRHSMRLQMDNVRIKFGWFHSSRLWLTCRLMPLVSLCGCFHKSFRSPRRDWALARCCECGERTNASSVYGQRLEWTAHQGHVGIANHTHAATVSPCMSHPGSTGLLSHPHSTGLLGSHLTETHGSPYHYTTWNREEVPRMVARYHHHWKWDEMLKRYPGPLCSAMANLALHCGKQMQHLAEMNGSAQSRMDSALKVAVQLRAAYDDSLVNDADGHDYHRYNVTKFNATTPPKIGWVDTHTASLPKERYIYTHRLELQF